MKARMTLLADSAAKLVGSAAEESQSALGLFQA